MDEPPTDEDLERRNRELETATETMRQFVATAAHELRGPMSAVMGFAQTMVRNWDRIPDEDKQQYLQIIVRRSRYLSRLLDSLLTLSKIEAGALEVRPEPVLVGAAIHEATEGLGEEAEDVAVECPPDLLTVADPTHVQQIVGNYVGNALKYGRPPVRVRAHAREGMVVIRVCDEGDGVPDDVAGRLFDRFTRARAADGEKGSGLGLSIVRGLALANGGEAWYEPHEPGGACFCVRLPEAEP